MMKSRKIVIEISEKDYLDFMLQYNNDRLDENIPFHRAKIAIATGTPLPEGAEILTKEAYSDLCLRASKGNKAGRWVLAEMGDTDLYECSLCRNRKTYVSQFCDICGAKMMGVEE